MNVRMPLFLAGAIVVARCIAPALAVASPTLTVDPDHTSAHFSIQHLAITHVSGSIPLHDATLSVDGNDVPTAVKASFDIAKITTQDDQRDNDLRSDHWFDVARDPEMTFASTKITPGASGAFTMDGTLTMHGVTKSVVLAGKFEGKVQDGRGRTHLGYSATGTIDRTQWSVGSAPPAIVGTGVAISIELEAIEK